MTQATCITCASHIENTAVTGVFCTACHEEEVAPPRGWRDLFRGPNGGAVGLGTAPFVVSFSINGVDYVALACGGLALTLGVVGLALAVRTSGEERRYRLGGAGLAVLLGLVQLYRALP